MSPTTEHQSRPALGARGLFSFLRTPLGVAAASWIGVLVLYYLPILNYPVLSGSFYAALLLAALGAVVGDMAGRLRTRTWKGGRHSSPAHLRIDVRRLRLHWWLCALFGLAGVFIIYIDLFGRISMSMFFQQQTSVKTVIERSLLGMFFSMFAYLALILGSVLRFSAGLSRWYLVAPFSLVALYAASYWGKLPLLCGIFLIVGTWLCIGRVAPRYRKTVRRRWPAWIRVSVAAVGLIVAISLLSWSMELRLAEFGRGYGAKIGVARQDLNDWLGEHRLLFGSARSAIFLYSYATNPLLGLDYYTSQPSQLSLGDLTFSYVSRVFQRLGVIENQVASPYVVAIRDGISVQLPTLLGYGYIDFGWIGIFVYPLAVVYCATVRYRRFLAHPTGYAIVPLAVYYAIILCSPWACLFALTETTLLLLMALWVGTFAQSRVRARPHRITGAVALERRAAPRPGSSLFPTSRTDGGCPHLP